MPALAKTVLHGRIVQALGAAVEQVSDVNAVPLRLRARDVGELALYAFTLTSPPGGRPTGEYKIQLILPDQPRGARGQLVFPLAVFTAIVGWSEEEDIFAIWDAYAHPTFAYSQNLQVKGEAVWLAQSSTLGTCERRLRKGRGTETVVACRPDHLLEGLQARIALSAQRLSEVTSTK